jgi:hypothetical protein
LVCYIAGAAQNYEYNSAIIVGAVASASKAVAISRASSLLIGDVVSASRVAGIIRSASNIIGGVVSASGTKGVNRAAEIAVGAVVTASKITGYVKSASIAIGAVVSASRAVSIIRSASTAIGAVVTAVKSRAYSQAASIAIGVVTTASKAIGFTRSASISIGQVVSASRSVAIARTASIITGIVVTSHGIYSYAAEIAIGVVVSASKAVNFIRSASLIIGDLVSASRTVAITRSAGVYGAAATEILRPNAPGDETSITSQAPASGAHWDKVDDESPDETSTCIFQGTSSYERDLYNIPNHSVGSGIINSIRIYFRFRSILSGHTAYAKPSQKSGDTITDGDEKTESNGVYTTFSQEYITNPATGNPWTWDEIDALQIGASIKGTHPYVVYLTQVYVEIDYTEVPEIENTPSLWEVNGEDPVSPNSSYAIGLDFFSVTNNSGGAVSITISGTDMTGGGYTWDLADDGNPGNMTYALKAGLYGGDYTIVVKEDEGEGYNYLVEGLDSEDSQDWGLKLWTPTTFTNEGNEKVGTVTLTATLD